MVTSLPDHLREIGQVPVVAFLGPSELEAALVMRVTGSHKHVLKVVRRQVQIEVIHLSAEEIKLTEELWSQRGPIQARVFDEIVAVLSHVGGSAMIDLAAEFVE